jgi:lysophospholipase L1-like esterase
MSRIIRLTRAHPRKLLAAVAALSTTVGLFAVTATTTADAADGNVPLIVGLGDSYSSGGSSDTFPGRGECWQSAGAYSLLAAKELGYRGKNYACSGAVTGDLTKSFKGQAAQISLIDADASWVVLTIGGNDIDILGTAAGSATQQSYATTMLPKTQTSIENVLKAIEQKAPKAKVMLLSYPSFLPSSGSCSNANTVGAAQLYKNLTATMKNAATATGASFLDVAPAFAGHDMCAADSWFAGSNGNIADHPNGKGYANIGKQLAAAIKAADAKGATSAAPTTTTLTTPKLQSAIQAKRWVLSPA